MCEQFQIYMQFVMCIFHNEKTSKVLFEIGEIVIKKKSLICFFEFYFLCYC